MVTADRRLYFDANAGAPLRPAARDAVVAALAVGNPSSVHAEGRAARGLVEGARQDVAELVGARPEHVTFTSGGTEANCTALSPRLRIDGREATVGRLLVSSVEHPSVLAGGRYPAAAVTRLPVDQNGILAPNTLREALAETAGEPAMVSVMLANNETGVIQPVAELAAVARAAGAVFHTDAIQAIGRLPIDIGDLDTDFLSVSAHKIGGPQGVGALIRASDRVSAMPLLTGGGQERSARAGTENVAAIAGFAAAARDTAAELARVPEWQAWRDRLAALMSANRRVSVVAADAPRLPQTVAALVDGVAGETLVMALDLAGVAVSAGSACSSGKVAASHVLAAMGLGQDRARSAVRISFGWHTGASDIDDFLAIWRDVVGRMLDAEDAEAA